MKIPNADIAFIHSSKITDYLLNEEHKDGKDKAIFFIKQGFTKYDHEIFKHAILEHVKLCEISKIKETVFGIKYIVDGKIKCPAGKQINIRSVWIIRNNEKVPELVTVYPK